MSAAATLREITPRNVNALADCIRDTSEGLRIVGRGTWLDAGHAVPAMQQLRLDAFSGVTAYVPDDLTISVGAATTLGELREVTRARRQWCPLESWGDDRASIGAVIATATAGPFAAMLGRPRDLVLGVSAVDGLGRVIHAGGRVVKNVAGFDLTRLLTGSWGTLAVITEVHLRLRALPAVDETWAVTAHSASALAAFIRGPYAPLACHQPSPALAAALEFNAEVTALLRIAGNASAVSAAREALHRCGSCTALPEQAWFAVRRIDAPSEPATQWRWDALSRRVKSQFDPRGILNPGLLGEQA